MIGVDELRIDYDDQIEDVIEKVNRLLRNSGLVLVDDAEPHDGYVILRLLPFTPKERL